MRCEGERMVIARIGTRRREMVQSEAEVRKGERRGRISSVGWYIRGAGESLAQGAWAEEEESEKANARSASTGSCWGSGRRTRPSGEQRSVAVGCGQLCHALPMPGLRAEREREGGVPRGRGGRGRSAASVTRVRKRASERARETCLGFRVVRHGCFCGCRA